MARIVSFGRISWFCALICLALSSCQSKNQNAPTHQTAPSASGSERSIEQTGGEKMTIRVSSTGFPDGGMIPSQHTCDGPNVWPPIEWAGLPTDAETITREGVGSSGGVWLARNEKRVPEAVPRDKTIPGGGGQGTNDHGQVGYSGPCPPSGTHRYYFKVYALDTQLDLDSTTTKDRLLRAMEGHVLAQGQLMGRYKRTG